MSSVDVARQEGDTIRRRTAADMHALEPAYPRWLLDHLGEQRQFIESLDPFPFDQPADTTSYHSLHQNDYLRLSNHPEVIRARQEAAGRVRIDSFSSSVFGGASPEHESFVELLRSSLDAGEVIVTTAGWTANVGLLEAIALPDLPIYIDAEAHASLMDGIRFSLGRRLLVRHNDPDHLEERIRIHGPGVVAIDALYSVDGTLSDLDRYVAICERNNCVLVLDEAHSFGMFGPRGGGLAVARGLARRIHFRTLSLSKALGGHGGAVVCGRNMGSHLWPRMRSVLFSSSTSAVLAAAHRAALEVTIRDPGRAAHCLEMAALLRALLGEHGIDTLGSESQIVSIKFDRTDACRLYGALRKRRVLGSVFVHPAVPKGVSMLRFSVHAEVRDADIRYVAGAVVDSLRELALNARDG